MNGRLTENEIDRLVIAEADDESAWEQPIRVNRHEVFRLISGRPFDIVSEKDVMGGEPVFRGTNVPVAALLENLEAGAPLDEFLEKFPTVSREQAIHVLQYFRKSLTELKDVA